MSEMEPTSDTAPALEPGIPPLRSRRLAFAASAGAVLALVVLILMVTISGDEQSNPEIKPRDNAVADLLAWIPADERSSRAFAVWTADPGLATPEPSEAALDLIERLSLEPVPPVLGRSPSWVGRFGWSAGQVTGWVSAGPGGELSVLDGDFDEATIARRLEDGGYRRARYHGADLYVLNDAATPTSLIDGDSTGAANAIALLYGRLIASTSGERVRAAIDVAVDGKGSLADEPTIAATLRSMAPLSALVAIDQADHAARCDPNAIAPAAAGPGRSNYVVVGYGRLGDERRTMVAVSFPDEAAATAAAPKYESGWISGFANAGGMGGSIDAFGRLTVASQSGNLLIAEIVDGRDDGWVRAGIRYAIPVCEAALALAPAASPVPSDVQARLTLIERLALSLPDTGGQGLFRAADLTAIATARGATPPEAGASAEDLAAWATAMAPLPAFSGLPGLPARLAAWSNGIGIPIAALSAIGEAQTAPGRQPVGVLIGSWDLDALTVALQALGYQWIDRGTVRHFAISADAMSDNAALEAAGASWQNIAVLGDRMWFSADQREMRAAVDQSLDPGSASMGVRQVVGSVLASTTSATAIEVIGADLARQRCGTAMPGILAAAATWTASAGGDGATLLYLPDGSVPDAELVDALAGRIAGIALQRPGAGGSPVPTTGVSLSNVLGYLGTERATSEAGSAIVARFTAPERGNEVEVGFFAGTTGDCGFTAAR